jgi:hypothetical protein
VGDLALIGTKIQGKVIANKPFRKYAICQKDG